MTDDVEQMSDVDLSSDSEVENEDENGVSLIIFKRPPVKTRTVEEVEIVPVSQRDSESNSANFSTQYREGIVKEYIDGKGLGVLLNRDEDGGLVLFHLNNFWSKEAFTSDAISLKERLRPGTRVGFLMKTFRQSEYGRFSEEEIIHQAVALWDEEDQPGNKSRLLKAGLGEENTRRLEDDRKTFLLNIKNERFLVSSLVRVHGKVAGYITDTLGIIDIEDRRDGSQEGKVFFHADDVIIYKKSVRERMGHCKRLLPVGAPVTVDARKVYVKKVKDVGYQAFVVLAGPYPATPFPTLLMGGPGSTAPSKRMPAGSTYYYLDLSLAVKLMGKIRELEIVQSERPGLEFDSRGVKFIQNRDDLDDWKEDMGDRFESGGKRRSDGSADLLDTFRYNRMVETEMAVRVTSKEVQSRTWYCPESWDYGGLRLKKEEAVDVEGGAGDSQAKRRKTS